MNLAGHDSANSRSRCRQWTPIISQQLRLRHVYQIIGYNLSQIDAIDEVEEYHYTLHSTAMSAPFYTSEMVSGMHPKWAEMNLNDLQVLGCTAFVLRIWNKSEIKLTWGVHLSGLVYLGNQLLDIRPDSFRDNTVLFHMRGGFFSSSTHLRQDLEHPLAFVDSLNVVSTKDLTMSYKLSSVRAPLSDIRTSYNLSKLKKLQALQIRIRNKNLSVHNVCARINEKLNPVAPPDDTQDATTPEQSNIRYAPQLLTMTHLNKLLKHEKPSRVARGEIIKLQKQIELARLRNKILQQERDRKSIELRGFKEKFNSKCDDNEERNLQLMEDYHHLSREMEKLREWKREYIHQREVLHQLSKKLQCRRRQLMSELLQLYPIHSENEKYYINGVELPHSHLLFNNSDAGHSVALGYCSHVLVMCAHFLQIPLRYPIRHEGSRSVITDQVKSREYPLHTRGKIGMLFNNAVFLLNKNITQYLHALGFKARDLRTTLPNLLLLLQGKANQVDTAISLASPDSIDGGRGESNENLAKPFASGCHHVPDPLLDTLRHSVHSPRRRARNKPPVEHPGLCQILAIPEAVLNQRMSGSAFLTLMNADLSILDQTGASTSSNTPESSGESKKEQTCDIVQRERESSIEEGKEMLPNVVDSSILLVADERTHNEEGSSLNSDPESPSQNEQCEFLNVSMETTPQGNRNQSEDLASSYDIQNWLDTGPHLVARSEENLFPEEFLGRTVEAAGSERHLTKRTDALLQHKSFNLVKPKM